MGRRAIAAAFALGLLVAGCGGDDAAEPARQAAGPPSLTVTVRPEGPDGPAHAAQIECERLGPQGRRAGVPAASAASRPTQLAPVPAATACTQIYGGPAARAGARRAAREAVDARFDRIDGCEIERWDRNRVLLGRRRACDRRSGGLEQAAVHGQRLRR